MKIQVNNTKLIDIHNQLLRFNHDYPLVFELLLGERVQKFSRNYSGRIETARNKLVELAEKYCQKDDNGFKIDNGQFVFNNELDKISYQNELAEVNKVFFDVVI